VSKWKRACDEGDGRVRRGEEGEEDEQEAGRGSKRKVA
jgi:hypothetical protein